MTDRVAVVARWCLVTVAFAVTAPFSVVVSFYLAALAAGA
jgi:hypothetical protein